MLLKRFKGTGPEIIILIFLIAVTVWAGAFIHPPQLPQAENPGAQMPLFRIVSYLSAYSPLASIMVSFLLVMLIAFLLVDFNTSALFLNERTFLPALMFVLISGIVHGLQYTGPALPSAVFLMLAVRRIAESYKYRETAYQFFDAGLLLGTGTLFYAPMIWFAFVLLAGIIIMRSFNFRELIISLIGLITPLFIVFGFMYVTGTSYEEILSTVVSGLQVKKPELSFMLTESVVLILVGFTVLISIGHMILVINAKKIRSRKTLLLLIWILIISAAVFLFVSPAAGGILWIAAIPASYFLSHFFLFSRKRIIAETVFLLIFAAVALLQVAMFI